jgi:GNAT superfamily N-acetyltransferase
VDKPRVEFIRVARSHQRQGYGTALYRRMTEELDRRFGFSLYASQLQRDCAEAAWEKLITLDWNDAEEEEVPFEGDSSTRYKISSKTKQMA